MLYVALLGFVWMVAACKFIRDEMVSLTIALPGAVIFMIGLLSGLIEHVSISWH